MNAKEMQQLASEKLKELVKEEIARVESLIKEAALEGRFQTSIEFEHPQAFNGVYKHFNALGFSFSRNNIWAFGETVSKEVTVYWS